MRSSVLLALVVVATPTALIAQQPAAPQTNLALMANDHYTRSHDYDLLHQKIEVSRFNWDNLGFEGRVTSTVASRRDGLDSLILDEGALLVNVRVADRAGHVLKTDRRGDTLVVQLAHPVRFGDSVVFTVTYHGHIKNGDGLTFLTSDGREHRPNQIWSQGEDHSNHYWFPTYDFPNDKATWELVATVPKANLAIANGRLVSNIIAGANRTMTWNQDKPSATYLVSLIVAPLALTHDSWRGIPVDYYTYHSDSALAYPLFHITTDMIDTYSRLTGIRYPWAKYAQTTVADFFGGMENVSATTLVDWLPDAKAYRDRPWYQYILIPHELAHQWFGDFVTTQNWANTWLNEGFAEFMPGQYWNEKLGAHAEQDYYLDEYRQYLGIERQRSMPLASMGSNNIYPKGALVLKMLKDYLGPERFWAGLHRYLTDHALGDATTEELRQSILAATGENLDWFWSEWIYGAGHPAFTVKATYDAPSARLTLDVKQTQTDTFHVDSTGRIFSVAPAFRMPVTIRVGVKGGELLRHAWITQREQTIVLDSISSDPTMVIFDDGNHILKSLTFDEPVAWLVEQLHQDSDLWDRQWVIDQLAKHATEPAATFALTEAAKRADYYLTRVQAVDALSLLPASVSMGSLGDATHDTSAAVRVAAYHGIEKAGGPNATAIARDGFHKDSSYDARAAALEALIQLAPDQSHTEIMLGLTTPSYRDVIRDAALNGVALTNDVGAIQVVDSLVGTEETPVHILAVLGGRGNTQALDLLTAHLNDPRKAVRGWALDAFEATLPRVSKPAAIDRLKAALPGLKYPETRQRATDMLTALQKP
ncbi:MAG TPA: M1 family aminopeptidase [Gemmatimonadales bacterium]|jgi:aminopeptidase N